MIKYSSPLSDIGIWRGLDLIGVENPLNDIAMQLVYLGILILVFMGITAVVLRFLPIFKEIKSFLLGLSALGATYVWVQMTFM